MFVEINPGDLEHTNFPNLLWKITQEKKTGILHLQKKEIEKKIFFHEGYPVHAQSNLLHESLEKYLVQEHFITEEQEQNIVAQCLEGQKSFQTILLDTGTITAAALSEALKANFVIKILDCFSWRKGTYSFQSESSFLENIIALKMNPVRLLIKGIETVVPFEIIERELLKNSDIKYCVLSNANIDTHVFQLNTEEVKFLHLLKNPKTLSVVAKESNRTWEQAARRIYAFLVLGIVHASEKEEMSLDELVGATLLQSLRPVELVQSVSQADQETKNLANEIAKDHMQLLSRDYFELLKIDQTATAVEIRDQFINFAIQYNPARFRTSALGDFKLQGEEIFLRGVKAYSTLSDFESKTKYLDKLKSQKQNADPNQKKIAGEAFKIQTKLLDATTQFQKGIHNLKEKNYSKALELFEYAVELDSQSACYLSYLGWTTYMIHPEKNGKIAQPMLRQAITMKNCDAASFFLLGKFLLANHKREEALGHLKKAVELSPKDIEMIRELRNAQHNL